MGFPDVRRLIAPALLTLLLAAGVARAASSSEPSAMATRLAFDYAQATDLWNGQALAVQQWATWLPAQPFTTTGGLVGITLRQAVGVVAGSSGHAIIAWRLNVDNAAATEQVGRAFWNQGGDGGVALGEMGGTAYFTGLSAGPHTVAVEYYSVFPIPGSGASATIAYLRRMGVAGAPFLPHTEFLRIQVVEHP